MPPGVPAVRAAERFYGDVLGLRRVPKPQRPVYPEQNPLPPVAVDGPRRARPRPAASTPAGATAPASAEGADPAGEDPTGADPTGVWFQGPCVDLHLGVEEPFRPARKAHPAVLVDDLDAVAHRITAAGGEARWNDDIPGVRRFHTDDPFGNRIELVERLDQPSPAMFEVVAEHSIYPIVMLDAEGTVRWSSASMERFFGYSPGDLTGRHFAEMVMPDSLDAAVEAFASVHDAYEVDPWGGVGVQLDLRHNDGYRLSCELAALTTRRTGLPWYVVLIRLAGYERALDQAVEAMAAGASVGNVLSLIVSAVENMFPRTGIAVCDRWNGDRFQVAAGPATNLLVTQPGSPWARALASGETVAIAGRDRLPGPLAALARAEGYRSCWVHPVSLADGDRPVAAIVVWRRHPGEPTRFNRNTLRKAGQLLRLTLQWDRSHRTLQFAATHDPLTGLANRQAFRDRLTAVAKAGEGQAAVLYLDLDRFKPVNDHLGHQTGDRALAVVAERLIGALRPGDLVARMGGDEFAVLCERLSSPDDVDRVAERLLTVIRQPIDSAAREDILLDMSIGVAEVHPGDMVDSVLARADEALRAAKEDGRGRWVRHSV
jgi:diguanylate cyclase (GGDEF)-like protein/PAS domain S-box-containing protein